MESTPFENIFKREIKKDAPNLIPNDKMEDFITYLQIKDTNAFNTYSLFLLENQTVHTIY